MHTNPNPKFESVKKALGFKPVPLFTHRKSIPSGDLKIGTFTQFPTNFVPLYRKHSLDSKLPTLQRKEAWNVYSAPQPISHHGSRLESIDIRPQTSSAHAKNDFARQSHRQTFLQSVRKKKIFSNSLWMNESMELPGEIADFELDNTCFSKYRPLPAIGGSTPETRKSRKKEKGLFPQYDHSFSSDSVSYSSTSSSEPSKKQSKYLRHKRKKINKSEDSSSSDESSKPNPLFQHVQGKNSVSNSDAKPRPLIRSNTYDVIKPFILNKSTQNEEPNQSPVKISDLKLYDFDKQDGNINEVNKEIALSWPASPLNSDEIILAVQIPNGNVIYGYFQKFHPLYSIIDHIENETKQSFQNYYVVTHDIPKRVFMDLKQSIRKANLNNKTLISIKINTEKDL